MNIPNWINKYLYVYTIYIYMYVYTYIYVCMYIYIERERYCMHTCVYIYIERERYTHTYTHIYIYIYICMHVYIYIYTYIYIYIYTHTSPQQPSLRALPGSEPVVIEISTMRDLGRSTSATLGRARPQGDRGSVGKKVALVDVIESGAFKVMLCFVHLPPNC